MEKTANFNDLETAFYYKKSSQLLFTYYIFKLLQSPLMVRTLGTIAQAVLKYRLPFSYMIKKTVFDVFCSGENLQDAMKSVKRLRNFQVSSVLDYVSEGERTSKAFASNAKIILANISRLSEDAAGASVSIKLSGLEEPEFFIRMNSGVSASDQDLHRIKTMRARLEEIAALAQQKNVTVYIDAEDRNMQDIFDRLTEELMEKFNTEKAVVYNTLQMYLTDRIAYLEKLLKSAARKNYFPGIKLVRGAYAEKERAGALREGVVSPVFETKAETDVSFNRAVEMCLQNRRLVYTCIASHNQRSTEFAVSCIQRFGISDHREKVKFSQLYGMSDHLTFNLAAGGYNSSKYMPYGEVRKAIPYLIRRAEENSSIGHQVSDELTRLRKEIFRRKINKRAIQ